MPERIAIIFGLEREAGPLVRGWKKVLRLGDSEIAPNAEAYRSDGMLAAIGGIGKANAAAAARWCLEHARPDLMVSAGFAGALVNSVAPPQVFFPGTVVDQVSGTSFHPDGADDGMVLVTADVVAGQVEKSNLAKQFKAQIVDMEATAVAEVAASAGIAFRAVKAVSEAVDFPMLPFDQFVGGDGRIRLTALLGHAAVHPATWRPLLRLGADCQHAAQSLGDALRHLDRASRQNFATERKLARL